jgi:hypothetical protein
MLPEQKLPQFASPKHPIQNHVTGKQTRSRRNCTPLFWSEHLFFLNVALLARFRLNGGTNRAKIAGFTGIRGRGLRSLAAQKLLSMKSTNPPTF